MIARSSELSVAQRFAILTGRYIRPTIAVLLAVAAAVAGILAAGELRAPQIGFSFGLDGTVVEVLPGSEAVRVGMRRGDILIRINGRPLAEASPYYARRQTGTTVTYEFLRDGTSREVVASWTPPMVRETIRRLMYYILAATFWVMGLGIFVSRPHIITNQLFLAVGSAAAAALWLTPFTRYAYPWAQQAIFVAHFVGGASFLHLHLRFPITQERSVRGLIGLSYLVAIGLSLVALTVHPSWLIDLINFRAVVNLYFLSTVLIGLFAMARAYRLGSGNARRRVRLIVAGTILGMLPLLATYVMIYFAGLNAPVDLAAAVLVLIPLTYALSLRDLDLMAVDYLVFRLLVVLVIGLVIIASYYVVLVVAAWIYPPLAEGTIAGALACLVVAQGLTPPIRRTVASSVGWVFHGQSEDPSVVLAESVRRLADRLDLETLWDVLCQRVPAAIGVTQSALYVRVGTGRFRRVGKNSGWPPSLSLSELPATLSTEPPPSQPVSCDFASGEHQVRWIVPLALTGRVHGLWLVGPRLKDESFSPRDLQLMQDAADQGAFVIQALELVGRLRHELERTESYANELRETYALLFRAQESERGRLSRDLHDGVLQQLYGLDMTLQRLKEQAETPTSVAYKITDVQAEILEAARRTRSICYGLRPGDLQQVGLSGALRRLARDCEERTDLEVKVEIEPQQKRIDEEVEVTLYYIAQEALNNVIKHSRAQHAEVVLRIGVENVSLFIQDDGVGFDLEQVEGRRLGLVGIQQRVDALGGTHVVETEPASGTALTILLPLPRSSETSE